MTDSGILQILPFSLNEKSILLLFFFLNGIFFTVLLTERGWRHQEASDYWLAAFILLSSLYIAPFMFGYAGWYSLPHLRSWLFQVPLQHLYLLGPVFYFYVKSLTGAKFSVQKTLLHFIPGISYLIFSLAIYLSANMGWYDYYASGRDPDLDLWYQLSGFLHMFAYFLITLPIYLKYRLVSVQNFSYAESILYRWLLKFIVLLLAIMVLRITFFILNPEWGEFGSKFWYYVSFSILVYYISFSGYAHSIRRESLGFPEFPADMDDLPNSFAKEPHRDVDLLLAENIKKHLEENKLYTHPDLTLQQLADHLSVTPKQVSAAINQGFSMNFNDLINQYRTRAVQEKIKAGEHEKKSLLGLALDCGFNSKSTFNRAFKKHTGKTPKEFINHMI